MNNSFTCVIDDTIRTPRVQRGAVFRHPVTRDKVRLGETSPDKYFEKFDLYPRMAVPEPAYDPERQERPQATLVWDSTAKTVTPMWAVGNKTLEQVATQKRAEISGRLDAGLSGLAAGNSSIRRETWPLFAEQAQLYKRNPSAPVRALRKRATKAGVPLDVMADRIIAKASVYEDGLAELSGQEDLLSDAIKAAEDDPIMTDDEKMDAILAIKWP